MHGVRVRGFYVPIFEFSTVRNFYPIENKEAEDYVGLEKAKILSAVMRTRALEERTRPFVEEFDNAGEWELALASVIGDFVKQKVTFPYDVAVLADHEFMPDDLVESMWTYATEEFDYEAHLDLLER